MSKMYVALGPNVFVKEIKHEVNIGGMIIPDSLDSDFTFGEVMSCSDGYFEHGTFVPNQVKVGDKVAFAKVSGSKVTFNDQKYIRVYASDIVAKEVEGEVLPEETIKQ